MALDPLNVVTPEILAMTWTNSDAVRMWFKRRRTTMAKLGLTTRPDGDRVRVVQIENGAESHGPAPDPADFEAWATEVDGLLEAAREDVEKDPVLQALFQEGHDPEAAVAEIIARRADALERSVTAPEASCADCDDTKPCWGAPDQCVERLPAPGGLEGEALRQADEAGTLPVPAFLAPIDAPAVEALDAVVDQDGDLAPEVAIAEGAEHPGVTGIREARPAAAPVSGVAPLSGEALAELSEAGFLAEVQGMLAAALVPSGEALHHELAEVTLRSVGRMVALRLDYLTSLAAAVAHPTRKKPNRENRLPLIIEALEREQGVSVLEMQALLGWDNTPGPWFFKEWARKADRLADLTDLGVIDGARRFRLLVR